MVAKQKTYTSVFQCAKCGEGEKEGRRHAARGLCKKCYTAEKKRGTLDDWPAAPAAKQGPPKNKSVILDSPIAVPGLAQEEEATAPAPAEGGPEPYMDADPEERQPPDPIVLTFESERNRHLRGWLELMAIVNRRVLEEEVYISLEHAANTFLERNSVLRNPETKQKFLEKVNT